MPEVPQEILSALYAFAKANGLDMGVAPEGSELPDEKPIFPKVNLNMAVSDIAHQTGLNLKRSGLYLYMDRLVTVEEDGSFLEMTAKRFRTWIDHFQLNFHKMKARAEGDDRPPEPIKATMKKDVAEVILSSDDFLCHIPVIKRLLPVRLPVYHNADDVRGVRLLPYGYDSETKVYTSNTGIDFATDWTLEDAVKYLRSLLKDFPFADTGRSLAVQISGMVTVFCQLLFHEADRWPMIYFNANQPGSGKSRLAELMIYAIYGSADTVTYSDNDEFEKKLDTWAQNGKAYTFIDDVGGLVKSNALNKWLTSPKWSGRRMHSQSMFSVFNQTLTLLTGNQATLSDDLGRRSLMVDLWSAELPGDRQGRLPMVIDAAWMTAVKNRQDILAALFAMVRFWANENECVPYQKQIPSFEAWSRMIPSIVTLAGFDCPLQAAAVRDAGQKQEVEFQRLLTAAVEQHKPELGKPVELRLTEWCALAREHGLFHGMISDYETMREIMDASPKLWKIVIEEHTGIERGPNEAQKMAQAMRYMDKGQSTKFGGILNKIYRGQIRTINGARYQFASREARHSTFAVERLPDAQDDSRP
jgi:hypothetical protein